MVWWFLLLGRMFVDDGGAVKHGIVLFAINLAWSFLRQFLCIAPEGLRKCQAFATLGCGCLDRSIGRDVMRAALVADARYCQRLCGNWRDCFGVAEARHRNGWR